METGDVIVTEEPVVDGTFCSYEIPNDICVEGKCLVNQFSHFFLNHNVCP